MEAQAPNGHEAGDSVSVGKVLFPEQTAPLDQRALAKQVCTQGWPMPLRLCVIHVQLLLALVISAAVVSAWRGAWVVLDASFLPESPLLSASLSVAIGCFILWSTTMWQPYLLIFARSQPSRVVWILDILFSYVALWCSVFVWRGVWQLWDQALGVGFDPAPPNPELERGGWLSHGVGTLAALLTGAMRSLSAAPMTYVSDSNPPVFGARSSPKLDIWHLGRLWRAPQIPAVLNEWRATVGLPLVLESENSIF